MSPHRAKRVSGLVSGTHATFTQKARAEMSTYTSTTDHAASIRAAYKAKGWSSRDISVKADYYSMGSAIRVQIKNPAVRAETARLIAEGYESIRRDAYGDIMGGGNRYVTMSYSREAETTIENLYRADLEAAAQLVEAGEPNHLHPIGTTGFLLGKDSNGYGFSLWSSGDVGRHIQNANKAIHLAIQLHASLKG